MKERRPDARLHDVRRPGGTPSSEVAPRVVRAGHAALDRALARAAARNVAQPPVSALRAACLTTFGTHVPVVAQSPAPLGRAIEAYSVTADRDDPATRVVHVSTVGEVAGTRGRYQLRAWRELSTASPN